MTKTILVPLDGSPHSETILPHVERFASIARADVRLAMVAGGGLSERVHAEAYLQDVTRRMKDRFAALMTTVLHGPVVDTIIGHALYEEADFIALSTHGRSGFPRLMFGSTAEELLRASPLPLLLARPDVVPQALTAVLIPLDGSKRAEAVLAPAGDFCLATGAEALLLAVLPVPGSGDEAGNNLHDAQHRLHGRGIKSQIFIESGAPTERIVSMAAHRGAGLIAIATHGRSGLDRLRYGSVAESVLRRSPCPLLVQRSVARAEQAPVGIPGYAT